MISSSIVLSTHEINKANRVCYYLEAIVLTVAHIFNNATEYYLLWFKWENELSWNDYTIYKQQLYLNEFMLRKSLEKCLVQS